MLSCKDLSAKASDYLDGELPLRTRMQIRLHTFLCNNCRRYLHQLRLAMGALALSADAQHDDRSEDRIPQLLSPIEENEQTPGEPEVVIYTTSWCPYCRRAKSLLDRKGVDYLEIDVEAEPARRREMVARAGGRTSVPQIFISGRGVGGSDELRALDASGRLDPLLGRA